MGNCRHSQHTVDHLDRMEKVLDIMGIICITVSSLYHHCIALYTIRRHDSMTLLLSFALWAMFRPLGTKRQICRACANWFAFGLLLRNGKLLEAIYRAGVSTLQGINISHLGKRNLIFKTALERDMLVPRRVNPIETNMLLDISSVAGHAPILSINTLFQGTDFPVHGMS